MERRLLLGALVGAVLLGGCGAAGPAPSGGGGGTGPSTGGTSGGRAVGTTTNSQGTDVGGTTGGTGGGRTVAGTPIATVRTGASGTPLAATGGTDSTAGSAPPGPSPSVRPAG